ncbi:hypothetical protein LOTGIDRAFT_223408 [Lottia gigantea]|uniref:Sigma non-opioid intracellular receptor 1 n=1 Tax=Lottia gigantea TaxID=225164 RepID=V3YWH0_LOTGI|nr:hypothetical protein LOTGIDRAFT_223408 [Lottia gigantea]ESO82343.1 hypothetical protein LOTGIDRAFT_223408 [Lottia gigantea]
MAFRRKLIKWILVIVFAIFCIKYWLEHKSFTFSHDSVAAIAKKYSGKSPEVAFPQIIKELRSKYPGHILPNKDQQWIFMNAGGWMGSMSVLHASLTEYVLLFGTALETTGHSGRYWANITDTLITGTFKQWKEGKLKHQIYKPGDTVYHEWGEVTAVSWTDNTWMVEYGRGFIPSTLGFALADTFFSTQDYITLYYILRVYTKALVQEAVCYIGELKHYLKDSF